MKIDEKIRQGVIESLPEASQIRDENLREKVYDAWAMSLSESGYSQLEEIPNSGTPDTDIAKIGTQADHLRGVARIAAAIATEFKDTFEGFDVDMDEVIAGGLCHDLGKPFEYANQQRWKSDPRITGKPSIRHTVYGVHVALTAGLPEKIAHIAGAHSLEGEYVERSLAAEIVYYADHAFWGILAKAGLADTMKTFSYNVLKTIP
ncbi:MAG: HD domain-containing protein [Planctomycetota bacterium]|jgi:putative nucleotidyltransferase with HDIG domain